MKVLQFPLARITLVFVTGIVLAYFVKPILSIALIFLALCGIAFLGIFYLNKTNRKYQFHFGMATFLLAFSIGIATQTLHTDTNRPNHYTRYKKLFDENHVFVLTLKEKLKSTTNNERYIVRLQSIDGKETNGLILLNIKKDNFNYPLIIQNQLKINGQLYPTSAPKNPNQFDYSKYLENKQIYAQLFAKPSEITLSPKIDKDIWYYTAKLRTQIITNLEKRKFGTKELNVAVALIMGQQQDIDPEIIQDYQYAGAVHILSVSGLHIGCLLLIITFVLKPFPNTKKGALLKLLITISLLFTFGILAGLSASVVRSVAMFSFVAIGHYLRRSVNIYHTLLVSIFLILLFQPSFLMDVGFQLSYIALFFIVWLQPLLANLWKPKNKILNYFWDILTVSFAAQIGTLPLSIYYFHQFPCLFFVTNLIVIPLLGFIMALGVLVMVLAALDELPLFLSHLLEIGIYYLNQIIKIIASLEQFIIKEIPLNSVLLFCSYLMIVTVILAFQKKQIRYVLCALAAIVLFQIFGIYTKWQIENQSELILLHSAKNTQLLERNGHDVILHTNTNVKNNQMIVAYLTANFSSLTKQTELKNVIYFEGKKILLIDSSKAYPKNTHPDIVILTQSPKLNISRLLQTLKPKMVIADGSNYKAIQRIWKESCRQQKIPFHSSYEKGFYRIY